MGMTWFCGLKSLVKHPFKLQTMEIFGQDSRPTKTMVGQAFKGIQGVFV